MRRARSRVRRDFRALPLPFDGKVGVGVTTATLPPHPSASSFYWRWKPLPHPRWEREQCNGRFNFSLRDSGKPPSAKML